MASDALDSARGDRGLHASRAGARARSCSPTQTGRLTGLFTDSDLARLFERRDERRSIGRSAK